MRTQSFPKNQHFLPHNLHIYVCVLEDKNYFFRMIVRTYWMEDPINVSWKVSLGSMHNLQKKFFLIPRSHHKW